MAEHGARAVEPTVLACLEAAPDGMLVVGADGVVLWANRSAHDVFAPRSGTLIGRPLGRPLLTDAAQRVEVLDSSGGARVAEMVANRVETAGEDLFVVSLRDLSRRDEDRERLKRQLERQDEVLSLVHEDAYQKVASLSLVVDELMSGWHLLADRERMSMTRMVGVRLDHLADVLLAWGGGLRDRSSLLDSDLERVDLLEVVTEGLQEWGRSNDEVHFVIEPGTTVRALPSHVWAVVHALLDNAFQHGRPPVILVAHQREDSTVLEVIDHGEGIGPLVRERLRLGYTHRAGDGGRPQQGKGLWLARSLVKAYGGSLHHQDVLGGGTRFLCSFPSTPPVRHG